VKGAFSCTKNQSNSKKPAKRDTQVTKKGEEEAQGLLELTHLKEKCPDEVSDEMENDPTGARIGEKTPSAGSEGGK